MNQWILPTVAIVLVFVLVYRLASRPAANRTSRARPEAKAKAEPRRAADAPMPNLSFEDDDEDMTRVGAQKKTLTPPTTRILYDEDAIADEPTQRHPLILVSASGQSDPGLRRRRNEDSVLVLEGAEVFAVADGMGGYRGGEIASKLAVNTLERAFTTGTFEGAAHESIPRRASELARAIQMANEAILERASQEKLLEGMGTTICAARFSRNKQRLYVGHVGDSRIYCYRDRRLARMTSDHTMADLGVTGDGAGHLSRAVGVWPTVPIDIILGKPRPGDVYLLCSDGLTKMVDDAEIETILSSRPPQEAVDALIRAANEHGGKDNVSVVIIRVEAPSTSAAA